MKFKSFLIKHFSRSETIPPLPRRVVRGEVLILFLLMAFAFPPKKTTVWLIGDSTMANKEIKGYPETGWGMPFTYFFDSTV
ncbi:MAG TPA: hypothetical protein VNS32_22210, partial [Flavisolibacter sp.]|nr:hypothetical protein [Flavisolibacter sp.]